MKKWVLDEKNDSIPDSTDREAMAKSIDKNKVAIDKWLYEIEFDTEKAIGPKTSWSESLSNTAKGLQAFLLITGLFASVLFESIIAYEAYEVYTSIMTQMAINASGCYISTQDGDKKISGQSFPTDTDVATCNMGVNVGFWEQGVSTTNALTGAFIYPLQNYCSCLPPESLYSACELDANVLYPECQLLYNSPAPADIEFTKPNSYNIDKYSPGVTPPCNTPIKAVLRDTNQLKKCKSQEITYTFQNISGLDAVLGPILHGLPNLNNPDSGIFGQLKSVVSIIITIGVLIFILKLLSGVHSSNASTLGKIADGSGKKGYSFKSKGKCKGLSKMIHIVDHWTLVPLLNNMC